MDLGNVTDRRRVFMRLTEKERFETLWDLISYSNSERVKLEARVVELENANRFLSGELEGISHRRADTLDLRSTSEKIRAVIADKWRFWIPIAQHVISNIFTIIALALLALAFGVKP